MSGRYFVYIMTNISNTTLYVGVTNDLKRRVWTHREKRISGFTQKYNIIKLVYYECLDEVKSAIAREKQIKNLVRRKKDKLIDDFNPGWNDLYDFLE